jgi:hypothetical protein
MKNILILALSLIIGQTALAQNTKTDIESLERKRFAAQVSKDFDFLEKIFSDDLVYTHSNAKVDKKSLYPSDLASLHCYKLLAQNNTYKKRATFSCYSFLQLPLLKKVTILMR